MTNTTIAYADGRTKETLLNGVVKTAYEYGPNWTKAYEGPAGLDSPRWSCSYEDALGRTVCETRPGFRGALLVTSNEYNTANQLVATRAYVLNENSTPTPLTYTYFCYNSLGQRTLTVSDMNRNNQIDWSDTDRIVSNDTRYVSLNGDWWRESSSWQTRQNGSPALTRVGLTRTRLTGHDGRARPPASPQGFLLSETHSYAPLNAVVRQSFVWDPTEPVATRPLAWFGSNAPPRLYTHDGNKNVSEVVVAASGANAAVEVVAHYDYAAFGAVIAQKGGCAETNPWRFSSEYEDTDLGLDYYNYRHYEPVTGRWLSRDPKTWKYLYQYFSLGMITIDYLGAEPQSAWGWNWYDFCVWYWLGFGKDVDLSDWYQLGEFKQRISGSIDELIAKVKSAISVSGCQKAGASSKRLTGTIPGTFSLHDLASSARDALWDSGKVLNEGRLEVSYNCDVTKNCSCCEKTGSLYKSENRAVCSLTFKLRDRFANPTDKVDLHADNYDQRQKCFKACLCRYDQWTDYLAISLGQGGQGEYFQCIQDCEKRYPDTDLLWATPYNITATWTDSKVFNLPVERCE